MAKAHVIQSAIHHAKMEETALVPIDVTAQIPLGGLEQLVQLTSKSVKMEPVIDGQTVLNFQDLIIVPHALLDSLDSEM